ncbi:MAG: CdaR family protein [Kiritimatiellae bacterium]|nr:CdaR family protein [Kiritimatiellia bacterium]
MKDKFKSLFRSPLHNIGLKLLALVLAVISWYAIRGAISFETLVNNVPLVMQLDGGWAVLERSTDLVDVVFRGSRDDLLRLEHGNIELLLDLRGREFAGSSEVRLKPDMVLYPGNARPVEIEPPNVVIQLDRQATRLVPVKVDVQGEPPDGFEMEIAQADPATVQISGPKKMIDTVNWIRTVPVPLEARRQSFRERLEMVQPGETWVARMDPPRVNARVTIRERSEVRQFKAMDVQALLNPQVDGTSIAISPISVIINIKGGTARVQDLKKTDIVPYVDCRQMVPGSQYDIPVKVQLPDGITLDHIDPAVVSVTYRVK